jgi:hypothetical protein
MQGELTIELEKELRAAIQPMNASRAGTLSHERAALFAEIDRLRVEVWSLKHGTPAGQRAGVPEGWKLVPVEPTETMEARGIIARHEDKPTVEVYAAMIDAAPTPPAGDAERDRRDAERYRAIRACGSEWSGLRVLNSRGELDPEALDEEADGLVAAIAASKGEPR